MTGLCYVKDLDLVVTSKMKDFSHMSPLNFAGDDINNVMERDVKESCILTCECQRR